MVLCCVSHGKGMFFLCLPGLGAHRGRKGESPLQPVRGGAPSLLGQGRAEPVHHVAALSLPEKKGRRCLRSPLPNRPPPPTAQLPPFSFLLINSLASLINPMKRTPGNTACQLCSLVL